MTPKLLPLFRLGDNPDTDFNTVLPTASSMELNNERTLDGTPNKLYFTMNHDTYCRLVCDNLVRIYEFDKTENKSLTLGLAMFEEVCVLSRNMLQQKCATDGSLIV